MAEGEGSVLSKSSSYLAGSWDELKKVSPPTRQETVQATLVTMVILFVVAMYLGLLDLVFYRLMAAVLS